MRMWMVEPELMCRKHLMGEHVELHMFVGTINKGNKLDGYVRNKLVEVHNIERRHNDLVNEMEKRGYNHKSKLPKFKVFILGKVDIDDNVEELNKRCLECRRLQNEKHTIS